MALVWEIDLPPGEKLVLLALADQANDEGRQCWPAVLTIAKKSGQGERTVRRALDSLEKAGHLTRDHRDGTSTQYHVHPCQNGRPAKSAPLPKTPKTPANLAGKTPRNTKPSEAKASSGKRATKFPSNFEPVMSGKTKATVDGWPPGRLEDELEHFADFHIAKGDQSFDWQASWRTWVKNSKRWEPRNGGQGRQQSNGLGRTARASLAAFPDSTLGRSARGVAPGYG